MKSFSQLTKEELSRAKNKKECCDRAEQMGILLFGTMATGGEEQYRIPPELVAEDCCKRAFVKGAFLGGGTVINPQKTYNLELTTPYPELAKDMMELLREFGFSFKRVRRQSKEVLYLKNSESISDFLSYIGAFRAQMELLNIKIEKEIRNDANRTANSEVANLGKIIDASMEQVRAIQDVDRRIGIENLPDDLKAIAKLRLANREASLSELGRMMNPPLTKSGINHRMKKLMQL